MTTEQAKKKGETLQSRILWYILGMCYDPGGVSFLLFMIPGIIFLTFCLFAVFNPCTSGIEYIILHLIVIITAIYIVNFQRINHPNYKIMLPVYSIAFGLNYIIFYIDAGKLVFDTVLLLLLFIYFISSIMKSVFLLLVPTYSEIWSDGYLDAMADLLKVRITGKYSDTLDEGPVQKIQLYLLIKWMATQKRYKIIKMFLIPDLYIDKLKHGKSIRVKVHKDDSKDIKLMLDTLK